MNKVRAPITAADLRHQAEAQLKGEKSGEFDHEAAAETERLLHELQVHQIELEMQNEELVRSRAEVEALFRQYSDLYDFAPLGYFTLDQNGTINQVNLTGANLLGVDRAHLVKQNFGHFVPEDARSDFLNFLGEVFKSGEQGTYETKLLKNGGGLLYVYMDAKISADDRECHAAVMDITSRKNTENSLRKIEHDYHELLEVALEQSNLDYRELLELASDGVFITDHEGQCILVNRAACDLVGYSKEELLSMNLSELAATDDLQKHPLQLDELYQIMELTLLHKNGTRVDCEISAKRLPDGRLQFLIRDITSRKRAEQLEQKRMEALELIAKGAALETVLKTIVEIVEVDLDDSICSILLLDESKQHLLLGAAPRLPDFYNEAIHGIAIGNGVGSCGTAAYLGQLVIAVDIETHPYWENYREVARRAGLRSCWSQPIFSSSGAVLGTFAVYHHHPCTPDAGQLEAILNTSNLASVAIERKHAEETILQYAAGLEHRVEQRTAELLYANRAKDEFLANMSHELRTPLNSVLGFSETLLEGVRGPLNERQLQAVEMINSSGEHLLGLINDILDLSKIESGLFELHPEVFAVNDICHASLSFIKQLAQKKSIHVEYIPSTVGALTADPKRLKQILVNLLSNAVKFTPEGGRISLEVQADIQRSQMRFSVTDTGIGIASDDLQKLFKPFVQVDSSLARQYEGTGLGLVLVKKLVEMHGGTVEVESTLGVGSCFTAILPLDQNVVHVNTDGLFVVEQESKTTSTETARPREEIKVLLVEDNESNVLVVRDYLQTHGYQVFVAYDGREALAQIESISPDVILMDIQMPGMDGLEATRRLRAAPKFASVPIIALTAFAMPGDRERCLDAGATLYLSKPVGLKQLVRTIDDLLKNPAK